MDDVKTINYLTPTPMPDQPKQKTAVQELIDYMEENFHLTEESRYEFKKALEKEQQQIMDAFDFGDENGYYGKTNFSCAEQYYSQTYNVKTN